MVRVSHRVTKLWKNHFCDKIRDLFNFVTMRRNYMHSNRSPQNWQNHNNAPMVSGGPLLTAHFGLQDIDKELELLKRKREIIEQQQLMLLNEFQRNEYQETQYNQNLHSDNYAKLYEPPSRKRPIAIWEDDIPSKRFSGQTFPRPRGFTRPPSLIAPMRTGYLGQPPHRFRPAHSRTKPQPKNIPKVTKNIPATAPSTNKPKTNPVIDQDVIESIDLTEDSSKTLGRLRADCEPSQKMNGRLELALGSILKDIRSDENHSELVMSQATIREVKKIVRNRIREVMVNRIVGNSEDIKARYREVYDEQSDTDLVADALEVLGNNNTTLLKLDSPEEYFKTNMTRIAQAKIKSMLRKLEANSRAVHGKPITVRDRQSGDSYYTDTDTTQLDLKFTKSEKYALLDNLMTFKIINMIKKHIPYILKIMDIDTKYSTLKNSITSETVKMLMQEQIYDDTLPKESVDVQMEAHVTPAKFSPKIQSSHKSPHKPLPYFVKIMGKPALPKRPQMQIFFEKFTPKSIKKHRNVHNLLFVGFDDKDSFDRVLAANGTVIGKNVLSIKVSERSQPEVKQLNVSASSDDKLFGPELDEQISELLCAIKQDNQNANEDTTMEEITGVVNEDSQEEAKNQAGNIEKDDHKNADEIDEGANANNLTDNGNADADISESVVVNADENNKKGDDKNADAIHDEANGNTLFDNVNADAVKSENANEHNISENADKGNSGNVDADNFANTDKVNSVSANEANSVNANEANLVNANEANSVNANEANSVNANEANSVNANEAKSVNANEGNSVNATEANSVNANEANSVNAKEANLVNANEAKSVKANEAKSVKANEANSVNANEAKSVNANEANSVKEANSVNANEANSVNANEANSVNTNEANSVNANEANSVNANEANSVNANEANSVNANKGNSGNAEDDNLVKAEDDNLVKAENDNAPQTDKQVLNDPCHTVKDILPAKETGGPSKDAKGIINLTDNVKQEKGNIGDKKDNKVTSTPVAAVKGTPVRASARLAGTPSRIQTRRTSKFL